jgi:sugar phosphate isomerase/epimerase
MYTALNTAALGVHPRDLAEAIEYARIGGFAGLEVDAPAIANLVDQRGLGEVRRLFDGAQIRAAGWGLPVNWRGGEQDWRTDLALLPRVAATVAALGATRCSTWIPPASDERQFEENRLFHIQRFAPIAEILAQNGCAIGLEFIGPKTFRDQWRYPFVYRMEDMLALAGAIGPNVGLLLDCWHWYTSGGSLDDLEALRVEQVVYVHINDAPAGI